MSREDKTREQKRSGRLTNCAAPRRAAQLYTIGNESGTGQSTCVCARSDDDDTAAAAEAEAEAGADDCDSVRGGDSLLYWRWELSSGNVGRFGPD